MWRLGALAFAAALALGVGLSSPASAAEPLEVRAKPTVTARVVAPTNALGAPRAGARQKMRLYGATAWSRSAQRLMVTGRYVDGGGRRWVRVQLPMRPNQASGWVRADRVRAQRHAGAVRGARALAHARDLARHAAPGRPSRPAWDAPATPTPVGRFAIEDPFVTLPAWRGVYGRFTLTLTAHSPALRSFMGGNGLVAIHGTGTGAGAAGGWAAASSNGCVVLSRARAGGGGPLREGGHPGPDHARLTDPRRRRRGARLA